MKNTDRIERIPSDADTVWRGDVFGAQLLLAFCRRFPSFRGKGSLYRWIASLCFQGDLPLKSVTGARFRIDAADFIAREIAFEGYYEPQSIALAMKIMGSGGVFVDVGCNVGLYTISVGSLPGVRVVAIDGSFVALARLSQNLKRNPGISAEIVSCALGAGNSVECFELPLHGNLGTTKVVDPTRERSPSRFWVASARLQYLLERFAPCRIRLLKMDVEGSELALFRGLDFDGPYRPENIIVECDPGFPDALKCFDFLVSKGYEPLTVRGKTVRDNHDLPEQNVWFRCPSLAPL